LKRILEPELMLSSQQALAYARADFSSAHSLYPKLFAAEFPHRKRKALVLDLGCGPCDVTRRFAQANPGWKFHALDGSPAMLKQARKILRCSGASVTRRLFRATNITTGGSQSRRYTLIHGVIPNVELPVTGYDVILSSSLLHHLADPGVLWDTIGRYAKPKTLVFVVDLRRPASRAAARQLMEQYARNEPAILRRDFENSLRAAFTPVEVRRQLRQAGLTTLRVRTITDRHLMVTGTIQSAVCRQTATSTNPFRSAASRTAD
jgi:SAM-dependent methyltransferase